MAVSLKHLFVSAKLDDADASVVRASNWNAEHALTMATGKLLGRATAGTGAAEEITLGTNLSLTGTTLNAAAIADGDKGDITVSAGGTTFTIDADAVTYAKLQNISGASRLLGRGAAGGAGDAEEITVGAGLTMTGTTLATSAAAPTILRGYIDGLILSNNVTDAVNDIDIAAGMAVDGTSAAYMTLAASLTKRLDAAWVVGTNQGGLDTGAIANTSYHIWLIQRSDTLVVDALFSASASAPTMPASYDRKRRIGSIIRAAAAIKTFKQDGNEFWWTTPVADVTANNPGTAAVTRTLTVPLGVRVKALMTVICNAANNTGMASAIYITDLSLPDTAPAYPSPSTIHVYSGSSPQMIMGGPASIWTNTSGQVRSRVQTSTTDTNLVMLTNGWIDPRGENA